MKLIYVNELGPNYKGDNVYEFIFSAQEDVWGDDWDVEPASGRPTPPHINFIEKVGVLKNSGIELNLIQNSDFFSVFDSVEGVIALGWEDSDCEAVTDKKYTRLVFHYGESEKSVADKFNENFNRDVGPITQKFRDRAAVKEDKSIMQIIEMLTASVNKKRSEQGMEELDRKTVLNNRFNKLEEEETKIQFPGSGVPLDIEDVLDFLTT